MEEGGRGVGIISHRTFFCQELQNIFAVMFSGHHSCPASSRLSLGYNLFRGTAERHFGKNFPATTSHTDWVRDVAWRPNLGIPSNTIASASEDGSVKIWKQDMEGTAWKCVATIVGFFGEGTAWKQYGDNCRRRVFWVVFFGEGERGGVCLQKYRYCRTRSTILTMGCYPRSS